MKNNPFLKCTSSFLQNFPNFLINPISAAKFLNPALLSADRYQQTLLVPSHSESCSNNQRHAGAELASVWRISQFHYPRNPEAPRLNKAGAQWTAQSTSQSPLGSCSRSPFRNSISSVSTFNDVSSSRILTQKSQKIKFAQSFSSYSGVFRLWETDRVLQRQALSSSTNRERNTVIKGRME